MSRTLLPTAAGLALALAALVCWGRGAIPLDREPGVVGALGSIRSALSIYYGDMEGQYPASLNALVPKYLPAIPPVAGLRAHRPTNAVVLADELRPTDSGGWLYVSNPRSKNWGAVAIDCTHDSGRGPWSSR